MNVECTVDVQCATSSPALPGDSEFTRWVELVTHDLPYSVSVSVRLVDEEESQELNKRYRMRDAATNVLSFPCDLKDEQDVRVLGDIVVCAPLVAREAESQGKEANNHWAHLVIHGVLHLLGHDHQEPDEALIMESLEITLLEQLKINNPYGEPA